MIIVVAALEFASQADRDEAVALVADVQRLTREEEPGCHDYCFATDPAVTTRVQVYELWEDSDSLAATSPDAFFHLKLLFALELFVVAVCRLRKPL